MNTVSFTYPAVKAYIKKYFFYLYLYKPLIAKNTFIFSFISHDLNIIVHIRRQCIDSARVKPGPLMLWKKCNKCKLTREKTSQL